MTELEAINAIYKRCIEGWETPGGLHARDAATYPTVGDDPAFVPLALKNETFTPEQLGTLGAWARVTIIWTAAEQITQGEAPVRKYERRGAIFVDMFGPLNAGVELMAKLSDDARAVLQGRRLAEELNVFEGESRNGIDDPAWATQQVVFRFAFEQTG